MDKGHSGRGTDAPDARLLDAIVEAAPFAILVVDAAGRIAFANRGAAELFGYEQGRLRGMAVDDLVPRGRREAHRLARHAFFRNPTERSMVGGPALAAVRSDGSEIPVEVALKPIRYGAERHVLGVVVDVTQRRMLEERVRRAHDELELRIRERTAELDRADAEKERLLADLQLKSRELERLSLEDSLTGLVNRRGLDARLDDACRHALRRRAPLAIAMFDLDRFKNINDEYGHGEGDKVLKQTAELLRRETRAGDVVARYGGEEFVLAFPDTDADGAAAICERIRSEFERVVRVTGAPALKPTISAGIASWGEATSAEDLLALADRRLYSAKRAGRNCVVRGERGTEARASGPRQESG